MERFNKLVSGCVKQGISDMHLVGGHPVVCRKNGVIFPQKDVIYRPEEVDALVRKLLNKTQLKILRSRWSLDFSLSKADARMRVNVFATARGLSLAVRFLPGSVPTLEALNINPELNKLAQAKSGFILFCGATGSGKTTTIASLLDEINRTRQAHILTLEDPIEYRFPSRQCFVEQRELGTHFPSFEQGMWDCLRETPDVIFVGEIRQPITMRLTLDAAEAGHLVFTTLHANSAEEALYRIFNSFAHDSEFIRQQMASCLTAIVVQQLVYDPRQGFRIPHLSILLGTNAVRSLIRDNKLTQIESTQEMSRNEGMFTFQRYEKEFLEKQTFFRRPELSFKPGKDSGREKTWFSPLIDYTAHAFGGNEMPQQSFWEGVDQTGGSNGFCIEGEGDLGAVISEMSTEEG